MWTNLNLTLLATGSPAKPWPTSSPNSSAPAKSQRAGLVWSSNAEPGARLRLQAALGSRKLDPDLRDLVASTRRRLARNRQQTLAAVVLMGTNPIVVTDGKITPKITFDLARR